MVVMDRQDYINKSNDLLAQPAKDLFPGTPLTKLMLNVLQYLKKLKIKQG